MPVPRYGSQTRVGRSVQYQGGGGFMAGSIKDLAGAGLHSAVDRNMPYLGTGRKMSKSVHIAGRVLGYGWERRSRSKKRTKVPWYISTYDVGGPQPTTARVRCCHKAGIISYPQPTVSTHKNQARAWRRWLRYCKSIGLSNTHLMD